MLILEPKQRYISCGWINEGKLLLDGVLHNSCRVCSRHSSFAFFPLPLHEKLRHPTSDEFLDSDWIQFDGHKASFCLAGIQETLERAWVNEWWTVGWVESLIPFRSIDICKNLHVLSEKRLPSWNDSTKNGVWNKELLPFCHSFAMIIDNIRGVRHYHLSPVARCYCHCYWHWLVTWDLFTGDIGHRYTQCAWTLSPSWSIFGHIC